MTMTDGEKLTYLGTDTVRWAEALVERFNIQTDDIGEVYGWTANMLMAGKDSRQALIEQLCEAIRLTREYVGAEVLPARPGWSWYDALVAAGKQPADVRPSGLTEAEVTRQKMVRSGTVPADAGPGQPGKNEGERAGLVGRGL